MSLAAKLLSASGGAVDKLYVDDVFSAYTYTGNGATQTINNGIDLAGKGGLVWVKSRTLRNHGLWDTARGPTSYLSSDLTNAAAISLTDGIASFNTNGWTALPKANGIPSDYINKPSEPYASWTFRKAPKFFDVVTYTGDGNTAARAISHSLGVAPGMIVVKCTNTSGTNWWTYHQSQGATKTALLNTTSAFASVSPWASAEPTSSSFYVGGTLDVNTNANTYVAYLFAHDSSADGIVQCGSFTTDGSGNATVNLGWEPQFLITKASSITNDWKIYDTMRGWATGGAGVKDDAELRPNTSDAETTASSTDLTATGFSYKGAVSATYIYLAIRRPNKPPTLGTQVYNAIVRTGTGAAATVTGIGFAPDLVAARGRSGNNRHVLTDKLRGATKELTTQYTGSEVSITQGLTSFNMDGFSLGSDTDWNGASTRIHHAFKRAPGVFDVVCYTGTGVAKTEAHNLGVVPELMIVKNRSSAFSWFTYDFFTGATNRMALESTAPAEASNANWNNTAPTATAFTVGFGSGVNGSGNGIVAYLFATKPGISKVGSYTGNGTSQTIDCGFTTGARFVLIKRTDAAGDWYVWDTARGVIAGNDPRLLLNTTAAEVTTDDSIDPDTSGFIVNQLAATNINVTSATYIYLAMA